jgi:SAM-dependent methyltransferase
MAPRYDRTARAQDQHLRGILSEVLTRTFRPGELLIEVGCGTGIEAKVLHDRGLRLVLTDLSWEMILRARERLRDGEDTFFVVVPCERLDLFRTRFDGAYACFGVLNCAESLKNFFCRLHPILKKDSFFVATLNNRWYLGDLLLFLLGKKNFFKKRLKGRGRIEVSGKEEPAIAFYYSYKEILRSCRPLFRVVSAFSLGFFLPPPYLGITRRLPPSAVGFLTFLERTLGRVYPFYLFGDQIGLVFQRCDR